MMSVEATTVEYDPVRDPVIGGGLVYHIHSRDRHFRTMTTVLCMGYDPVVAGKHRYRGLPARLLVFQLH